MAHREPNLDTYYFNGGHRVENGRLEGLHRFDPDDLYFEGHFPGDSVVPGVVVIQGMLTGVRLLRGDEPVRAYRLRRVRFKKVLRPLDAVRFVLKPAGEDGVYAATVFCNEERVALGEIEWISQEERHDRSAN